MFGVELIGLAFAQAEFEMKMAKKRDELFEATIAPLPPEKQAELRALRMIARENKPVTAVHVHNRTSIF